MFSRVFVRRVQRFFGIRRRTRVAPMVTQLPTSFDCKNSQIGIKINHDGKKRSAFELLSFKNISFFEITSIWPEIKNIKKDVVEQIEIEYYEERDYFRALLFCLRL